MGEYADEAVDRAIMQGAEHTAGGNCNYCRAMITWRRGKNGAWQCFDYDSNKKHYCRAMDIRRRAQIARDFEELP